MSTYSDPSGLQAPVAHAAAPDVSGLPNGRPVNGSLRVTTASVPVVAMSGSAGSNVTEKVYPASATNGFPTRSPDRARKTYTVPSLVPTAKSLPSAEKEPSDVCAGTACFQRSLPVRVSHRAEYCAPDGDPPSAAMRSPVGL